MPHSLRSKIKGLRYKGIITDKDCDRLCKMLDNEDMLDKIRTEIKEKYGGYDICEWFVDYDYEENNISEYRLVGNMSDILAIIDKYKAESEETETWNGIHAQISAPKGTFEQIFNDADNDNDI